MNRQAEMNGATDQHAIVIGGSIAGLLTARVLSDFFTNVTIIERDQLPTGAETRKGVPQGRHGHGLLAGGYQVIERLLPGIGAEWVAAGALPCDMIGDFRWYQMGGYKAKFQSGLRGVLLSRPLLEAVLRRRVLALPNVRLQADTVRDLVANADRSRITGVRLEGDAVLSADLVVDAAGRGSRSLAWLEALGYAKPPEEVVQINVGYATRMLRRRPTDLNGDLGAAIAPIAPHETRAGFAVPVDSERWLVSLGGWLGDHPPTDPDGWLEFARSLGCSDLYEMLKDAEPLGDIVVHKVPANIRRRYDQLRQAPAGFLVTGDAMCAFNPVYGQGMTVAAMEAVALQECLTTDRNLQNLHYRFFARAAKVIDIPWMMTTGEDFRYPAVQGKRPWGTALLHRYMDRVHRVATYDEVVCRTFFDVANMLQTPGVLFQPRILRRVLLGKGLGERSAATQPMPPQPTPSLQGGLS